MMSFQERLESYYYTYQLLCRYDHFYQTLYLNFQEVLSLAFDCDSDCILLQVKQIGAACHTGERSCFHREVAL